LYETSDGVYSATLVPGEYIINAETNNYKELSEYFVSTKGECTAGFIMDKKSPSTLTMTAVDITTGNSIAGTLVKLSTLAKGMNVENVTDVEGKVMYKTDGNGYYRMQVSRENYISYTKELCISKKSASNIMFPLIPSNKFGVQICLSGDSGIEGLSLKVHCPNTQEGDEILSSNHTEALNGRAKLLNESKVGGLVVLSSDMDEWFRVCVELRGSKFTSVVKNDLDKYLQNPLQSVNVVVHIIVNGSLKYTVQPPSSISGSVWDIGFVNPLNGDLMAINSITEVKPVNRLDNFKEFISFYAYIAVKPDIRNTLGFGKSGETKLDDIIMDQGTFGTIAATSAGIPKEKEEEFKTKLIGSVSDTFGNVSLRRLTKLVNLNKGQSDIENTRTLWTTTIGGTKKIPFGFLRGYVYKKLVSETVSPKKKEVLVEDKETMQDFGRKEFENQTKEVPEEEKPVYIPMKKQESFKDQKEEEKKSIHSEHEIQAEEAKDDKEDFKSKSKNTLEDSEGGEKEDYGQDQFENENSPEAKESEKEDSDDAAMDDLLEGEAAHKIATEAHKEQILEAIERRRAEEDA
jgi:hypothetical protein